MHHATVKCQTVVTICFLPQATAAQTSLAYSMHMKHAPRPLFARLLIIAMICLQGRLTAKVHAAARLTVMPRAMMAPNRNEVPGDRDPLVVHKAGQMKSPPCLLAVARARHNHLGYLVIPVLHRLKRSPTFLHGYVQGRCATQSLTVARIPHVAVDAGRFSPRYGVLLRIGRPVSSQDELARKVLIQHMLVAGLPVDRGM
jgi:hypothetical protein